MLVTCTYVRIKQVKSRALSCAIYLITDFPTIYIMEAAMYCLNMAEILSSNFMLLIS